MPIKIRSLPETAHTLSINFFLWANADGFRRRLLFKLFPQNIAEPVSKQGYGRQIFHVFSVFCRAFRENEQFFINYSARFFN